MAKWDAWGSRLKYAAATEGRVWAMLCPASEEESLRAHVEAIGAHAGSVGTMEKAEGFPGYVCVTFGPVIAPPAYAG